MQSIIEETNIVLVQIRQEIREREQVIEQARKMLEEAIEAGAVCQQCYPADDGGLKPKLDEVSSIYAETEEMIAEQIAAIEFLKRLEQIGERFTTFGIPATFAGGGERDREHDD